MKEEIREQMLEIEAIVEGVENDPKVAKQAERNKRRYGIITPEELRQEFTI